MNSGPDPAKWLVDKTSGFLDRRLSRRSFISKATIAGTAVAASGCAVITGAGSPYTYVTDCRGGLCRDGYTEFCCVINNGMNSCPPGTAAAGWWRADYSVFCDGTRYYIDCNNWEGAGPCRCAAGCDTRKVYCNHFRYGQCNGQIPGTGVIACRMVTCVPPYFLNIGCDVSGAVDNATANHNANCPPPPPPPPPPPSAVPTKPNLGTALSTGAGLRSVFGRITGGHVGSWSFNGSWTTSDLLGDALSKVEAVDGTGGLDLFVRTSGRTLATSRFDGSAWSAWNDLGGYVTTDPAAVAIGSNRFVFVRSSDNAYYLNRFDGSTWSGWTSLGGRLTSDPSAVVVGSTIWLFARGGNSAFFANHYNGSSWTGWATIGGFLTSDPSAVVSGSDVFVFGRGGDNSVFVNRLSGGAWSGWQPLGGGIVSDPVAVADSSGVWLFALGGGNALYSNRFTSGGWSGWALRGGGSLTSNPEPVADGAAVSVFCRQSDRTMGVINFDGTTWDAAFATVGAAATLEPVNGTS